MRIVELRAENVKRLHAVHIKPNGNIVQITGRNGQGKSSVLDSIMYALAGGDSLPAKPVREGAEKAEVVIDLGDKIVRRRFSAVSGNSTVTVEAKDGARFPSPQKILDDLVGTLTFDPLGFTRMKPTEQVATLKAVAGLDFAQLDHDRQVAFESRTGINREVKQLESQLAGMPAVDAPDAEVSVADLSRALGEAHEAKRKNDEIRRAAVKLDQDAQLAASHAMASEDLGRKELARIDADGRQRLENINRSIEAYRRQIAELERQIQQCTQDRLAAEQDIAETRTAAEAQAAAEHKKRVQVSAEMDASAKAAADAAAALVDPDTDAIQKQISEAEVINRNVRARKSRAALADKLQATRQQADALTRKIDTIDETKARTLREAKLPVNGLGFNLQGITLNGIPFDQASSAEQLRVSVAMGISLNPKLRVMLIRDGSLLDGESLAMLSELAEQHDLQVWLERVSDGQPVGVVIEDGYAAGDGAVPIEADAAPVTA